jgi:hypothetical protein
MKSCGQVCCHGIANVPPRLICGETLVDIKEAPYWGSPPEARESPCLLDRAHDWCAVLRARRTKLNLWRLQMRQLLALSVLLLGVSWAVAQDSSSQTSPTPSSPTQTTPDQGTSGQSTASQTPSDQTSPGQTSANASGETTVQGCLSGAQGSYTLTDASGNTYQLTGDTSKLSSHVNQEVKVTGTSAAGSPAPASTDGSAASTAAQAGAASQQTLQVSSVTHISKTCQSGAASH